MYTDNIYSKCHLKESQNVYTLIAANFVKGTIIVKQQYETIHAEKIKRLHGP